MYTFLISIWAATKLWLGRGAFVIGLLILILHSLHVELPEAALPTLMVAVLIGLYELGLETIKDVKESVRNTGEHSHALAQIEKDIGRLAYDRSIPKIYSLWECRKEIERYLRDVPSGSVIGIDHIGLDLHQAWEYIHHILFAGEQRFACVKYRVLILSDRRSKCWPKDVADWSKCSPDHRENPRRSRGGEREHAA